MMSDNEFLQRFMEASEATREAVRRVLDNKNHPEIRKALTMIQNGADADEVVNYINGLTLA